MRIIFLAIFSVACMKMPPKDLPLVPGVPNRNDDGSIDWGKFPMMQPNEKLSQNELQEKRRFARRMDALDLEPLSGKFKGQESSADIAAIQEQMRKGEKPSFLVNKPKPKPQERPQTRKDLNREAQELCTTVILYEEGTDSLLDLEMEKKSID